MAPRSSTAGGGRAAFTVVVLVFGFLLGFLVASLRGNVKSSGTPHTIRTLVEVERSMVTKSMALMELPVVRAHLPNQRVVVCISSFGGRVQSIEETVKSLLEQNFGLPDKLYLSVPSVVERIKQDEIQKFTGKNSTEDFLASLTKRYAPTLQVLRSQDYGPATKLLGCLPEEPAPSTYVLTMDDDVVYHKDTLGYLVGSLHNLPPKLAAAFVCESYNPLRDKFGWRGSFQDKSEGACAGFLAAYTGAAYRRDFFAADVKSDSLYNYTGAPAGCKVHDDVWISGNLFRRGVRPYVIGTGGMWPQVSHRPYNALSINSVDDMKGKQKACLEHFNYFMEAEA